jgi:hypothetical protein
MINSPLRILLTDDDLGDRIVFAEIFEEMELETTVQNPDKLTTQFQFKLTT